MNAATLIRIGISASMMLLVVALGMRSNAGDAVYLLRRPELLGRSLLAMYVLMPLLVIGLALSFDLHPAVKIALVALAVSPIPPFLPSKQLRLTTDSGYIYGLLIAASLLSILWVPATTSFLGKHLPVGRDHVTAFTVAKIVALSVLVPLMVGMIVKRFWPRSAVRLEAIGNTVGTIMLVVAIIPLVLAQWHSMVVLIGNGTVLAIVIFTCLGLVIGHLLGGPREDHRTVLALATSSRHPAVALAVASVAFPRGSHAIGAVLLALLVSLLTSLPYSLWRKRVHVAALSGVGRAD